MRPSLYKIFVGAKMGHRGMWLVEPIDQKHTLLSMRMAPVKLTAGVFGVARWSGYRLLYTLSLDVISHREC